MKDYEMKQCKLRRGDVITTTWIPIKFAIKGKFLKLKDEGIWTNGWQVISVYGPTKLYSDVKERSQEYKHNRSITDI